MQPSWLVALSLVGILVRASTSVALEQQPVTVSPGSNEGSSVIAQRCPTFSWGAMEGAVGYEVVVYELSEEPSVQGEEVSPLIRKSLPGTVFSWTPSLAQCLEPGGQYEWYIRAEEEYEGGIWSEGRLFEVEETPSFREVRGALKVLKRYLEERGESEALSELEWLDREESSEKPAPGALDLPKRDLPPLTVGTELGIPVLSDLPGQDPPVTVLPDWSGNSAIVGELSATTGWTHGVVGVTNSTEGGASGVHGFVNATSGGACGVYGVTNSIEGRGVYGYAIAPSGTTYGVYGQSGSTGGRGVYGYANATSGGAYGVYGLSQSNTGRGVSGYAVASSGTNYGVYGQTGSTGGRGVYGYAQAATGTTYGVYGRVSSPTGYAGYFDGDVNVSGTLTKTAGSFKIDHPLEPAKKYLYHSFVESPDMMNIYNGNVSLDEQGEAQVELPAWFEALNRDFRYQLTTVGSFAPVYIAEKIRDNRFKIAGGESGMEVSWQVTGIRRDAWAEAHPISVEEDKSEQEVGTYLHPEELGFDKTLGRDYQRNTELRKPVDAKVGSRSEKR